MELMDAIKTRRSVRRMTDQPLTDDQLDTLLEAIRWAPSWSNTQCWEVVLVSGPAMKQNLADLLTRNPATKAMIQAPVIFVMCAKLASSGYYHDQPTTEKGDLYLHDTAMATQNLLLAAHDMGLGAVVVGLFDGRKVSEYLNIPDGYAVVSMVPVGHPDHSPKDQLRRETSEFSHQERW